MVVCVVNVHFKVLLLNIANSKMEVSQLVGVLAIFLLKRQGLGGLADSQSEENQVSFA